MKCLIKSQKRKNALFLEAVSPQKCACTRLSGQSADSIANFCDGDL